MKFIMVDEVYIVYVDTWGTVGPVIMIRNCICETRNSLSILNLYFYKFNLIIEETVGI